MGWRTFGSRMVACKLRKILTRTDPGKDDVGPRHITASSTFWHFFFLIFQTSHLLVESWKPLEGSYNQTCTGFFKFWSPPSEPQGVYHSRYSVRDQSSNSVCFHCFSDSIFWHAGRVEETWKRWEHNWIQHDAALWYHTNSRKICNMCLTCCSDMNENEHKGWYGMIWQSAIISLDSW